MREGMLSAGAEERREEEEEEEEVITPSVDLALSKRVTDTSIHHSSYSQIIGTHSRSRTE